MINEDEFGTDLNGEPPVKDKEKGKGYQDKMNHIDKLLTDFEDMLEQSKQDVNKEKNKDNSDSSSEDEKEEYEESEREENPDVDEDAIGDKPAKKGKKGHLSDIVDSCACCYWGLWIF